jgi:hypothetical protein
MLGVSFTGAGNVPAATWRQSVDLENGMKERSCACLMKPVCGRIGTDGVGEALAEAFGE